MDSTNNSSVVQLHPETKPTQKRTLENLEDWDNRQTYMVLKKHKLQSQFDAMKTEGKSTKSAILEGVTIYVNGWTEPSAAELKEMIYEHGGRYVYNLYGHSNVTHTIASNLPNSKILKIGKSIVCKPEWIVDSIAAKQKLPVENYLLYKTQDGQTKLMFPKLKLHNIIPNIDSEEQNSQASGNQNATLPDDRIQPTASGVADPKATTTPTNKADFVKEFFTHSRLHYLSTWSMELKQFLADKLRSVTPKFPKLEAADSLRSSNSRAVVHIDLDCFFVSASLRKNPHLRGKPVAVTHAKRDAHATASESLSAGPEDQNFEGSDEELVNFQSSDILPQDRVGKDVGKRTYPNLQESTSDIASCSYEARKFGICNGMSVGAAMKKCSDLILLPYDFEAYREVSQKFYVILLQYSSVIEAVSCDEAYVEFTDYCRSYEQVMGVVGELRKEVMRETDCTVSAGISHNMLLARMSTRVAKPDGQFLLMPDQVDHFLSNQRVRDLPGVGYSTAAKIQEMKIANCGELLNVSLSKLQTMFGSKFGRTLYDYARGADDRELKTSTERKSVSVDINFGIRFKDLSEAEALVGNLAEELQRRAEEAGVAGTHITLKMKIRKQDAPRETRKYLGHGACDNVSRSMALLQPVKEATECSRLAMKLLKQVRPAVEDIRGMGLQLSKLVSLIRDGRDGRGVAHGQQLLQFFKSESKQSSSVKEREDTNGFPPSVLDQPRRTEKQLKKLGDPPTKLHSPPRRAKTWRRRGGGASAAPTKRSPAKKSPTKTSPAKSPVRSLRHYFKSAVETKSASVAAAAAVADSLPVAPTSSLPSKAVRNLDESFMLDLPPASQLDHGVLDALPVQLREKIMASYNNKKVTDKLVPAEDSGLACANGIFESREIIGNGAATCSGSVNKVVEQAVETEEDEVVVVNNEDRLLEDWKRDIHEWTESFCDGPTDDDLLMVASHFCKMVSSNLKMVEVCLKVFRRYLVSQDLSVWMPCFNVLLEQIQGKVRLVYGGSLKVEPLMSLRHSCSELS